MAILTLLLEACGLLGFTWWLLGRYRDPHVSSVGLGAVFLSWSLGFLGLLLLPIDIAHHSNSFAVNVDEDDEDDTASLDAANLPNYLHVWQALYWLTFALSWFVLPMLFEFSQNGQFHLQTRLVDSIRRLVLHWTIVVGVLTVGVAYLLLVGHFTAQGLLGLAMASANTYGLLWLIVLLGYGLVDIPRSLWTLRTPELRLRSLHFQATQVHGERMEAIFLYQDVLREVRSSYDRMLQAEGASIILTSDMQEVKTCLKTVMMLVDANERDQETGSSSTTTTASSKSSFTKMRSSASPMLSTSTMDLTPPSYSDVVDLHRRVKSAQADLRGSEQAWLELCLAAESLQRQIGTHVAQAPAGIYSTTNMLSQMQTLVSFTKNQMQRVLLPPLWALAAVVGTIGSVCILWGELTMAWTAKLSLFHVLSYFGFDQPSAMEVLAFALLVYMVLCAYTSLFKLRSFGRFALRGHGNSSELALLKTSIHQCRLQFALGYNFLLLVQEPQLTEATAFHQLWSHMQVIRVFGRDFSVYAPVLMAVLVVCTMGNVYAKVMKGVIGMEQYEQLVPGHPDHETQITKGERLIQKGLAKLRNEQARTQQKQSQWRGRGFVFSDTSKTPPDMAASLLDGDHQYDADNHGGDESVP